MLFQLFVIDNGLCIYSYNFRKSKSNIDEQLLSGFLMAIGSFAEETFQTGLQSIQIRSGEKLSFYINKKNNLVFCAISDERDNAKLLEQILQEISDTFSEKYHNILNSNNRSLTNQYDNFTEDLKNTIKGKDKKRNLWTSIQGLFMGTLTSIIAVIIYGIFLTEMQGFVLLIYLPLMLWISSFISGYFAGTKQSGYKNGIFFFVIMIWALDRMVPGSINVVGPILPYVLVLCMAGGYFGGIKCDEKKLYPLPEDTIVENVKIKIEERKSDSIVYDYTNKE